MRIARVCLAAAGLVSLLAGPPAPAQIQVRGVLLDAGSGAPIPDAHVHLGASRGFWRQETRTDSAGGFAFDDVRPGPYRLRARRVGYRESAGTLRLSADSVVQVQLRMSAASVALQPVTVVARSRRSVSPVLQGFYGRLERGHGRFVTRDEIEARNPTRVTDLLRTLPNLNSSAGRGGVGGARISRGSSGGRCTVVFFVDGMLVSEPSMGNPLRGGGRQDQSIDDYVSPREIEGIEVYRGESDTPAEFVTRWVGCGTIVIWTQRGEMRGN